MAEKQVRVVGVTRKELNRTHAEFRKRVQAESERFRIFAEIKRHESKGEKT